MSTYVSRRHLIAALLPLAVALFATNRPASGQQQEATAASTEEHKLLQKDVGTWDATIKIWGAPDADPIESKGTEKNELLPGGLWIISRFDGKIGDIPFAGVGVSGYDPVEKKYVGTWVDSMTPHMMPLKGDYDQETQTMTMTGEGRDPATGETYEARLISRYVDENSRTFEFHMPGEDGQRWKMMEIQYQRRSQ